MSLQTIENDFYAACDAIAAGDFETPRIIAQQDKLELQASADQRSATAEGMLDLEHVEVMARYAADCLIPSPRGASV